MGPPLRLLLDTHTLIWWTYESPKLSLKARDSVFEPDAEVFVSAVSAMEIATKFGLGKLPDAAYLAQNLDSYVDEQGFQKLSVTFSDGLRAGRLPLHHKDPFDRLLIAQAIGGNFTLVSNETIFETYGAKRLW